MLDVGDCASTVARMHNIIVPVHPPLAAPSRSQPLSRVFCPLAQICTIIWKSLSS